MTDQRRILVVGCGAIGGIFAASLAAVADVVAYDANEDHVRAIREHGLRVSGASERLARLPATGNAAELAGRFDALLFLIKSSATASALQQLKAVVAGRPLLVTLQNGMGNSEVLLAAGDCPVARGVTTDAGRYVGPGHVEHLIRGKTWLGPIRGDMGDVRWLGALLTEAGLPAETVDDPMEAVWSKFVFNSVMNPIGALLLGVNAARYEAREVCALIDDMAAECEQVVHALGGRFAYDPLDYVKKVRAGQAPLSTHAGSMAQDIARGVPTEIDELTGFIVREGDRLGIPVPACRTVWRLVKGLEIAARRTRL
ncbi:MAG TPA: ketopantoate reductase family protein [Alphaproteobacteria bacterium]|nr:ketopantoate reductase family protein [Alphaproteobacteria bacterium]